MSTASFTQTTTSLSQADLAAHAGQTVRADPGPHPRRHLRGRFYRRAPWALHLVPGSGGGGGGPLRRVRRVDSAP